MTDMEMQMVRALAAIDAELGMPEDGCNSTQATLTAIRLLHAVRRDDEAEIERLRAALAAGCSGFHDDGSAPPRIQGLLNALRPNF